jgi:hypothetical protein
MVPNPSISQKPFHKIALLALIFILAVTVAGCGDNGDKSTHHDLNMASLENMPAEVKSAPLVVQEAYQFAAANPDLMTHIPCYCGCGEMGHTSNYACYVSGQGPDGKLEYDQHALGCSICVDITQDSMRLFEQGKSLAEVRSYIDSTYSQYGPSNIP